MAKYKHLFDTTHLNSNIKKRSLQSGAVTVGSQGIMLVIQLGSTMILARVLNPQDYGINAMAVAITGFATIFSNLGLSTATIQRADINHEQVSSLFWINVGIGFLITLITAAISPAVAWFYKTPEMLGVILTLSTIFTISGFSVQHSALLTRQMRFAAIAFINIISLLLGIIVAIIAAYYEYGYWALVFNTITNVTIRTLGMWYACKWVPGVPSFKTNIGTMVKFGSDLVGFDVINYFARNLDNILIGRYHGTTALGLYSKAYQLLMMPITNLRGPVMNVAMPALSRLQNEPEQYSRYYLKCVSLLAFVSMPLVAFMFVYSESLITLLLGPKWLGTSEIFKILAIAAFIQPVSSTSGMVLISMGKSRLYLKLGIFSSVFICLSFVAGLPWGPKGVAVGYSIVNYLLLFPVFFYTVKDTKISIKKILYAMYKPLIASLVMGIGALLLCLYIGDTNTISTLIMGLPVSTGLYLIVFTFLPDGVDELREYYHYKKIILERTK